MKKSKIVEDLKPKNCCSVCGAKDKELRPYGKDFAMICFECGMKDENLTGKNFMKIHFNE